MHSSTVSIDASCRFSCCKTCRLGLRLILACLVMSDLCPVLHTMDGSMS
jgi:hypothetical protein